MKIITKLMVVAIVFSLTTQAFAQEFGVRAGLNISNMLAKDDDDTYSDDFSSKLGFHVGGTVEFPFSDMFALETGLFINTKGFKYTEDDIEARSDDEYKMTLNLYYIDIPINAKGIYDAGDVKVFATAGPYIGVGLTGKWKYKMTYMGEEDEDTEDVKWGSDEDEDDFKRLDLGLGFGAGVEYKAFLVGLGYNVGLANISPYSDNGYKENNRVFQVTFGYKFGGEE